MKTTSVSPAPSKISHDDAALRALKKTVFSRSSRHRSSPRYCASDFGPTHEFLSQKLPVRRPGVTVAIGALEKRELIAHRYGKITILDMGALESAVCECYRTVKDRGRELLA